MLLGGHGAAVLTGEFDPTGEHLATGSFDKTICARPSLRRLKPRAALTAQLRDGAVLWNVYGECENYGVLTGHKNAVLELHWSSDSRCGGVRRALDVADRPVLRSMIFSCSADQTVAVWDTEVCRHSPPRPARCTSPLAADPGAGEALLGPRILRQQRGTDDQGSPASGQRSRRRHGDGTAAAVVSRAASAAHARRRPVRSCGTCGPRRQLRHSQTGIR